MNWSVKAIFILIAIVPVFAFGQDTVPTMPGTTPDPIFNSNNGTSTPNLKNQLSDGVKESQANNETLYQNALANPSSAPGAVIKPSGDSAMIATPDGPAKGSELNLTDAEKRLSEEFVHDGKALREQEKLCAELEDPSACRGTEPKSKFAGMDSGMVMALSKAYTMVIGSMDMGFKMKPKTSDVSADGNIKPVTKGDVTTSDIRKDGKIVGKEKTITNDDGVSTTTKYDADGKETSSKTTKSDKKKDQKDYCKYVAVGTEAVAMFQTQMTAKNAAIPAGKDTAQKEILYKAARTHKERAKSHKLQYTGWGITTGCYAYMLTLGGAQLTWGAGLKLASSWIMTAFFKDQADLNEEYYNSVKGIADKLPGKGDCNPITDKDCYCAQEETMNDPQVCLPELHANKIKLGNYRVACMDAQGQVDPKCTCIDADNCLNKRVMNKLKPFGFGTAFHSAALKPLNNLARGELTSQDLSSASNGELAAYNKRAIQKLNPKVPSSGALTSAQQKAVIDMNKMGLPPKFAALIAKQKITPRMNSNMARFRGGSVGRSSRGYRSSRRKRGNVLNFSGGSGINKKARRKSGGNQFSKFMNKMKKGKGRRKGKVLNYQNRALQSAQISKDKDRPIFEIISRRYQVSGYKRLEVNR